MFWISLTKSHRLQAVATVMSEESPQGTRPLVAAPLLVLEVPVLLVLVLPVVPVVFEVSVVPLLLVLEVPPLLVLVLPVVPVVFEVSVVPLLPEPPLPLLLDPAGAETLQVAVPPGPVNVPT